jgi:5'-methylthioadenosine phosphorylase
MKVGIIGGSGLYDLEGMTRVERRRVETPLGSPSDDFMVGRLGDVEVCFLPRHGAGHRLLPSEINHKANIMAMKIMGVERVISISAVGSLREDMAPRDLVLPAQYFDRTKRGADQTFFGRGVVAHVGFGDPTCCVMLKIIAGCAEELIAGSGLSPKPRVHKCGTYVNMEGPAFSTRAESNTYRKLGFDVIGMTSLAEAKLCREAEICYQPIAMVTDYDCWHESEEDVSVEMVIGHLKANTSLAKALLERVIPLLPEERTCPCASALAGAVFSDLSTAPHSTLSSLMPILSKYIKPGT